MKARSAVGGLWRSCLAALLLASGPAAHAQDEGLNDTQREGQLLLGQANPRRSLAEVSPLY
jgi:hypothetical protein